MKFLSEHRNNSVAQTRCWGRKNNEKWDGKAHAGSGTGSDIDCDKCRTTDVWAAGSEETVSVSVEETEESTENVKTASSSNLITNGDFETDASGWTFCWVVAIIRQT